VEVFKYLGRLIAYDDANNQAMRRNLRKVHGCWAWVSCVLRAENVSPRTSRVFYKATVQAVLLYGSETWSLSPSSVKRLEGFHICAVWQMMGNRTKRNVDGSWTYPCSADVLNAAGLKTITHYMEVRQQTVTNFIINQPIYELCAGAVRKRGSPVQPFRWDQPMNLDTARRRGLWPLPQQGPPGPAIVTDKDED
jgi:hypothetical protein